MKDITAKLYDYSGEIVFTEETPVKKFLFMKFLNKGIKSTGLSVDEIDIQKSIKELNKNNEELTIKSVLVSDDEEILREAYVDTLTRLCHYVEAYPTADEAYEVLEEEPTRFDVILTDNNMPQSKLNGAAYAKKAKALTLKVKVHIITGEISSVDDDIFDHHIDNTIPKPLNEFTFAMTIGKGKVLMENKPSNVINFEEKKRLLSKEDLPDIEELKNA